MNLLAKSDIFSRIKAFLKAHPQGVIEILGPTASGKTGFSLDLAEYINNLRTQELKDSRTEIISADSRQVYIGCDISAAKISKKEMRGIPHHGIDLLTMQEPFDVKQFQTFAFDQIKAIHARNNIPLLCGGTMLWLDAVSENYVFSEEKLNNKSNGQLISSQVPKPVRRSFSKGGFLSFKKSNKKRPPRYPFLKIGLHWQRETLYGRINQRAREQFENGLIEETRSLLSAHGSLTDLHPNITSSFGYLEISQYLEGLLTYDEALSINQQRNRNYAKRQLTWWRGREDIVWIDGESL